MTHHWHDERSRSQAGWIVVLAGVVMLIAASFFVLENRRSEEFIAREVRFQEALDGEIIAVDFRARRLTEAHWDHVIKTEGVHRIQLVDCHVLENDLDPLLRFPNLKFLSFVNSPGVTERHLAQLKELTQLIQLKIDSCDSVGDGSVPHFVEIPSLQSLCMKQTGLTFDGMTQLITMRPDINFLVCPSEFLSQPPPGRHDEFWLETEQDVDDYLAVFDLYDPTTGVWATGSPIEQRHYLHFSGPYSFAVLRKLARRENSLEDVILVSPDFSHGPPPPVRPLKQVRHLSIVGTEESQDLPNLSAWFPNLESFAGHHFRIPPGVNLSPDLTSLLLTGLKAGSDLSGFTQNERLTRLWVRSTDGPVEGITQLIQTSPKLEALRLGGDVITRDVMSAVASSHSIRLLDLECPDDFRVEELSPLFENEGSHQFEVIRFPIWVKLEQINRIASQLPAKGVIAGSQLVYGEIPSNWVDPWIVETSTDGESESDYGIHQQW